MGRLLQVRELQAILRLLLHRLLHRLRHRHRHRHRRHRHRHRPETFRVRMADQVYLVQRLDRQLQRRVWGQGRVLFEGLFVG